MTSDNFWSAFCVFHAHFWRKTHSFKICALKKRNDFRQLKRCNFRVEKCKTAENWVKFLNNMAYKIETSMKDCVMKRDLCKTWKGFILIKCKCFIIKINHVWSCVKNIAKKPIVFQKKRIVFKHVHFFIPLFWNEKLSLEMTKNSYYIWLCFVVHLFKKRHDWKRLVSVV